MPKAKGRSRPRKKAEERQPSRQGFVGFVTSPVVRRLLLVVVVVVLLYVVWEGMLRLLGYGLIIMAVALGWLIWLAWQRRFSVVKHRWNWVLGGVILALAAWGILSFFPGEGVIGDATLGGRVGLSIIRAPDALGALRVAGLVLLGMVLIMPRRARSGIQKLRVAASSGQGLLARSLRRRPATSVPLLAPAKEAAPDAIAPEAEAIAEVDAKPAGVPSPPVWQSQHEPILTPGGWQLPPIDILEKPTEVKLDKDDIDQRARLIEEALASYGVEAKVVQANIGPTVTQFGVEPGWDRKYREVRERGRDGVYGTRHEEVSRTRVRVDRITSLSNDLSLALAAPSIRIEAPVPGASVVGIEVPNSVFGSVALRGVIETAAFQKIKGRSKLAIAMGKGAGGEAAAADLTRMPHLLIAGSTGSGKTVCLNSIICCLLLHNSPDDVQFIMIDPKRVELVTFNGLPHLLAPVIVDSGRAVKALRWLTYEMDNRYREFAQVGARNIEGYNRDRSPGEQIPYLVLVIDELADLMLVAADEVEHTLCRLAQLARATGIHLVVATQRPSVDVVTGLIKANFPTRVSFAVTSQVDSRTILDMVGAEKLLGRGDMLYMPTEASKPKRLQGTMVLDAEIDRLVYFWGNQRQIEVRSVDFDEAGEHGSGVQIASAPDPLLGDAMRLAQEHKHISASFLQRRLHVGYPRAARLMEELEQAGLIETAQPGRQG